MNALALLARLIQDEPPDTIPYLILGYVIIAAVGLGYIVTLVIRQRNLRRDLDMLERLEKDED
jgi:hypothetical protein